MPAQACFNARRTGTLGVEVSTSRHNYIADRERFPLQSSTVLIKMVQYYIANKILKIVVYTAPMESDTRPQRSHRTEGNSLRRTSERIGIITCYSLPTTDNR